METQTAPFTKKQLKELEGYVALSTSITRSIGFLITLILVGGILNAIQRNFPPTLPPLWLILTIAIGIIIYVKAGKWTGGRKLRNKIRQDLKNGSCNYLIIEPTDVIEYAELEDEGPSYLIKTIDKETIFLSGQFLERHKRRKFPWEKFAIQEAPASKISFGIQKMGDPISVTEQRPPLEYCVLKQIGAFNGDYVVLSSRELELLS